MGPDKRSPALVIILSIVTCGIYYWYWIYCVSNEIKVFLDDPDINPGLEVLLSIVTCGIYTFYWYYKMNQKMVIMGQRADMLVTDNSVVCIILAVLGLSIVSMAIMQNQLNDIWNNTYYRPVQ